MIGMIFKTCRDEIGATAIEYAFLAALISLAIIGGLSSVGSSVLNHFEIVASSFPEEE